MMNRFMERQSHPILPHSLSDVDDADLVSSFSDFLRKDMCIRRELDFDLRPCVF